MAGLLLATLFVGGGDAFSTPNRFYRHVAPTKQHVSPLLATSSSSLPWTEDIWTLCPPKRIEGTSLKTWAFNARSAKRVQVSITSLGRPIEASVELWQTPSYIPTKFKVQCEDATVNVVHTVIELPQDSPVTVAVYNKECAQFPMEASVAVTGLGSALESFAGQKSELVQGDGAVKGYFFGPDVESVEILLKTNKRNMKAYIEILLGPNEDNEIINVDTDNANMHPFYTVIQTPGGANTLRIVNENTVEFPFEAYVRPFKTVSDEGKGFKYGGPYF